MSFLRIGELARVNPFTMPSLPLRETKYAHPLCREFEPELFFVNPSDKKATEKAKMICDFCPHRIECKADARTRGDMYGVFGGEDEDQRKKFLRTGRQTSRRYSAVHELASWGLKINEIAMRLNIKPESVSANLRRSKVRP